MTVEFLIFLPQINERRRHFVVNVSFAIILFFVPGCSKYIRGTISFILMGENREEDDSGYNFTNVVAVDKHETNTASCKYLNHFNLTRLPYTYFVGIQIKMLKERSIITQSKYL
jgi:hypothetical protein